MEISVTSDGGEKRVPLEIGGEVEEHTSKISHEKIKGFSKNNSEIKEIDFEIGDDNKLNSLDLEIPDIIDIEVLNGEIRKFIIKMPDVTVNHAGGIRENRNSKQKQKNIVEEKDNIENLPPIPDINREYMSDGYVKRYNSLENKGTQPYLIRKIIFEEGEITRKQLKERLRQMGYHNIEVGKSHTGVNSTLRVLDEFTNEIERDGRGENKILRWISN